MLEWYKNKKAKKKLTQNGADIIMHVNKLHKLLMDLNDETVDLLEEDSEKDHLSWETIATCRSLISLCRLYTNAHHALFDEKLIHNLNNIAAIMEDFPTELSDGDELKQEAADLLLTERFKKCKFESKSFHLNKEYVEREKKNEK